METATMHTRAAIEIKAILEERMEGVYNKDIKKFFPYTLQAQLLSILKSH